MDFSTHLLGPYFVLVTFTSIAMVTISLWWRYHSHFTAEETEVQGMKIGCGKYMVKVREMVEAGYKTWNHEHIL